MGDEILKLKKDHPSIIKLLHTATGGYLKSSETNLLVFVRNNIHIYHFIKHPAGGPGRMRNASRSLKHDVTLVVM